MSKTSNINAIIYTELRSGLLGAHGFEVSRHFKPALYETTVEDPPKLQGFVRMQDPRRRQEADRKRP